MSNYLLSLKRSCLITGVYPTSLGTLENALPVLGRWMNDEPLWFEIEQVSGSDIAERLRMIISGYDSAKKRANQLGDSVKKIYTTSAEIILTKKS